VFVSVIQCKAKPSTISFLLTIQELLISNTTACHHIPDYLNNSYKATEIQKPTSSKRVITLSNHCYATVAMAQSDFTLAMVA